MRRHRELHVNILIWDYPMIFGLDREWAPLYGLSWKPHRRICFRYDNTHPVGGSHHQKVVVIDDAIAFSGGIDLTVAPLGHVRALAAEPAPRDGRCPLPAVPRHDDGGRGPAARALGDLLRDRWRACHARDARSAVDEEEHVPACRPASGRTSWPASIEHPVRDVAVGISRPRRR